ncbi:MAG: DHHA1 domain-containing protein [Patescibacteria group bacterium]
MNPRLVEYAKRFRSESLPALDKFYTQLGGDYIEKLPYLHGIQSFCIRLLQALINEEKICIYSDYDTDAVTATAVMYWGLVELGFLKENLDFYAPDRFVEGYGMNTKAVKELALKYDLIVSVDCGINSAEEAEIVNALKSQELPNNFRKNSYCDLIITDHHHLQGGLPKCSSVLNPRLAQYYYEHSGKISKIDPGNLDFLNRDSVAKIEDWITKSYRRSESFKDSPNSFMSESVTGVGVAWFAVAWLGYFLNDVYASNLKISNLNKLLPLVAIGTVADCQSILQSTNRTLVKAGLKMLNISAPITSGLEALLEQLGFPEKLNSGYQLTSQDLAFILSPILNSSGRVSHAKLSIACMLGENNQHNQQSIAQLIQTNQDRKVMVKEILEEVDNQAKDQVQNGFKVIWLEGDWSKGIVGLLASRLVNRYNLPVVVVAKEEHVDTISASLRAPEGYHIPKALTEMGDLLLKGGGHPGAAGFSAKIHKLIELRPKFEKVMVLQSANLNQNSPVYAPGWVELSLQPGTEFFGEYPHLRYKKNLLWVPEVEIDSTLLNDIFLLDPYGQDFPLPGIVTCLKLSQLDYRWLGNDQKHIKGVLQTRVKFVVFNISPKFKDVLMDLDSLKTVQNIWLELKVSQNSWNGQTNFELIADKIWL